MNRRQFLSVEAAGVFASSANFAEAFADQKVR